MGEKYDLFISYKSENANEVRGIVDRLIASGLSVWFAEYEIGFDQFDDDAAIQSAIDAGIDESLHALIFTNDRWAGSEYCRNEIERILSRLSPRDIVDVQIPPENRPHRDFPPIRDLPTPPVVYGNDPLEVIAYLARLDWFPSKLTRVPPGTRSVEPHRAELRFGITFDRALLGEPPGPIRGDRWKIGRAIVGECFYFEGSILGHRVRLMFMLNPYRPALQSAAIEQAGEADDRAVYKIYRLFAARWLETNHHDAHGLHLLFWEGRSHLGLSTSHRRTIEQRRLWERRYALLLRDPNSRNVGELDIVFGVDFPADWDVRRARKEFCRVTPIFDEIVRSVRYRPIDTLLAPEAIAVVVMKLAACAVVAALYWNAFRNGAGAVVQAVAACAIGMLTMDVISAMQSREVRRETDLWGMVIGPRLSMLNDLPPAVLRVRNLLVGTIVAVSTGALVTLFNPLTLAGIGIGIHERWTSPWFWGLLGAGAYMTGQMMKRLAPGANRPWR